MAIERIIDTSHHDDDAMSADYRSDVASAELDDGGPGNG